MDPRIQAALIAAFSALVGVVIGGFIQSYQKNRELKREKRIAEGAATLYLCRLRLLFEAFSERDSAISNLSLGISPNENNLSEIEMIKDVVKVHDSFLLVKLFDIKQNIHNIRLYAKSYHKNVKKSGSYKDRDAIIGCMIVDAKSGIRGVDVCIKHAFNLSEDETKRFLLENQDFRKFLPNIIGNTWVQRLKIRLNVLSKI